MRLSHRQQAGLITLCNLILGELALLISTNQIPIDERVAWLFPIVLVVINARSLWLDNIFDAGADPDVKSSL